VQSIDQALDHPQTKALGIVQTVPNSDMTLMGMPARFDGQRPAVRSASSALNADAHLLAPYLDAAKVTE
jgi:crotonobetainyl-CoA:carnitine CoA-transferase CaiB-like acyl-CoA transferase